MIRPDTADSVMSMADLDLSIRACTPLAWRDENRSSRAATPMRGAPSRMRIDSPSGRSPISTARSTPVSRASIRSETRKETSSPSIGQRPKSSVERPPWKGVSPKLVKDTDKPKTKPKYKKTKLRKATNYVDESLFGAKSSHRSVEEEHRELHNLLQTKPFMEPKKPETPNRAKARDYTRMDFSNPFCELPGGPKGDGRRFKTTNTLKGAYDVPRPAKPGTPPYKPQGAKLLQHSKHRPSSQPKTKLSSPFVHETVPRPQRRPKPVNPLWGNHPDV